MVPELVEQVRADEVLSAEDYGVEERGVSCRQHGAQIGPHALFREEREFVREHDGCQLFFRLLTGP